MLHGVLALRDKFEIKKNGKRISALDWIAEGASYRGESLFQVTKYGGRAHPYSLPYAFEGHPNQTLAILTMSNLPLDFKLMADKGEISISQIVENSKMEVNANEEITWSLWALSHYLPPDESWTNRYGEEWSIERLVQIQTYETVNDAACGGSHGLYALSYARNRYIQTKQPMRGIWLEADQKIKRYVEEARQLQNSDGSFSASFFEGPNHSTDFSERLATSGHTLEFLIMALPQHRLDEKWIRDGVGAVTRDLLEHSKEPVRCAPLYHALHALVLYRDRTQAKAERIAAKLKATKSEPAKLKPAELKPIKPIATEPIKIEPSASGVDAKKIAKTLDKTDGDTQATTADEESAKSDSNDEEFVKPIVRKSGKEQAKVESD
jgi:hypothetical protein